TAVRLVRRKATRPVVSGSAPDAMTMPLEEEFDLLALHPLTGELGARRTRVRECALLAKQHPHQPFHLPNTTQRVGRGNPCPDRPSLVRTSVSATVWAVPSRVGGTAYAVVSNTTARKGLWVRIPHPARTVGGGHESGLVPHIRPQETVDSALRASDAGMGDAENAALHGVAVKTIRRWRR